MAVARSPASCRPQATYVGRGLRRGHTDEPWTPQEASVYSGSPRTLGGPQLLLLMCRVPSAALGLVRLPADPLRGPWVLKSK